MPRQSKTLYIECSKQGLPVTVMQTYPAVRVSSISEFPGLTDKTFLDGVPLYVHTGGDEEYEVTNGDYTSNSVESDGPRAGWYKIAELDITNPVDIKEKGASK